MFVQNPQRVVDAFTDIDRAIEGDKRGAFYALGSEGIRTLFVQNPDAFVELARVAGIRTANAFYLLENEEIAARFTQNPQQVVDAISEIIRAAGAGSRRVFWAFYDGAIVGKFLDYCDKKISLDQIMIMILSSDDVSGSLGGPLDELHADGPKRQKYLDSLSTLQVFALLCSDPEHFYTSSNHMLFDRLRKDLGTKTVNELFVEYGVFGTEQCRNFLFRAINYDRLYGKKDSLLKAADVKGILPTLLEPLTSSAYDKTYLTQLANAISMIKGIPEILEQIKPIVEARLGEQNLSAEWRAALEFICVLIDPKTSLVSDEKKTEIKKLEGADIFDPELYKNDGKLTVLQVFDKEDTGKDHWGMTVSWFTRYFGKKPTTGANGELIYENSTAKLILFMGENDGANQEFIQQQLQETPNLIATFRGHSFSLEDNFPHEIFGNESGHILFIPGSCGSALSIPDYVSANPNTDLRFVSTSSTGRGQVTNAVVEAFLGAGRKKFEEFLADAQNSIVRQGGDVSTLKVWTKGEALMRYVLNETGGPPDQTIEVQPDPQFY
ncbi:Uncharacterised protein [Candidatus Burarchaeum australiense]|nr:Uncharacterised protein [Candidatus Burarchaeum australiense]